MTDRDDNFQAAAGAAPAVSGDQILARLAERRPDLGVV
jgi:hypothetical protein